jgi:ketosteroid isomerase-like protein
VPTRLSPRRSRGRVCGRRARVRVRRTGAIPGAGGMYRGPEAFRQFLDRWWGEFHEAHVEVHELIDAGDHVLADLTFRGRGRQSGVETNWSLWQLWTLRDGKAVRGQGFTSRGGGPRSGGGARRPPSRPLPHTSRGFEGRNRGQPLDRARVGRRASAKVSSAPNDDCECAVAVDRVPPGASSSQSGAGATRAPEPRRSLSREAAPVHWLAHCRATGPAAVRVPSGPLGQPRRDRSPR